MAAGSGSWGRPCGWVRGVVEDKLEGGCVGFAIEATGADTIPDAGPIGLAMREGLEDGGWGLRALVLTEGVGDCGRGFGTLVLTEGVDN